MKGPQSFIFIGRSGSGKGTQAELLIDHLKKQDENNSVLYVETGAEFRDFIDQGGSHTADLAKKIQEEGGLMPEFLATYLWAHRLVSGAIANQHLIFDGSPRKYDEALVMDSVFDFYKIPRPIVIYLNVGEVWARSRLTERQRADDNQDDIQNRMAWFASNVQPAIDFYKKNPLYNFHEIDAERSVSEIHTDIRALIQI